MLQKGLIFLVILRYEKKENLKKFKRDGLFFKVIFEKG